MTSSDWQLEKIWFSGVQMNTGVVVAIPPGIHWQ